MTSKYKVGDILFYRGETSGYLKVEEIREENGEIRYYETSRNIYLVENDPDVFTDKVCSVEAEETKPIDLTVKGEETKERIEITIPEDYEYVIESGKIIFTKKSPKTDDIIKWLREHDMTKYIGVIYSGMCSITFDTEGLIKDITEMIGDE